MAQAQDKGTSPLDDIGIDDALDTMSLCALEMRGALGAFIDRLRRLPRPYPLQAVSQVALVLTAAQVRHMRDDLDQVLEEAARDLPQVQP